MRCMGQAAFVFFVGGSWFFLSSTRFSLVFGSLRFLEFLDVLGFVTFLLGGFWMFWAFGFSPLPAFEEPCGVG